ncbi:type I-E CRISPR-associated protein Cas6/Cse3/CasE [Fluviispira multicolorata]|nr:type I-E CRISPR-associated protein Cas6/Cse3/CasE [Fluviispira multicolorata]
MINFINIKFEQSIPNFHFLGDANLPYKIHQLVECAQKDENSHARILWRMDSLNRSIPNILVQVNSEINKERLLSKIKNLNLTANIEYKMLEPNFENGQTFMFKLRANPTKAMPVLGSKTSKRIPLGVVKDKSIPCEEKNKIIYTELKKWLDSKAKNHGFSIINCDFFKEDCHELESILQGKFSSYFNSVLFMGTLKVTDAVLFKHAIQNGIGSAKSFGFGMLSIKRI